MPGACASGFTNRYPVRLPMSHCGQFLQVRCDRIFSTKYRPSLGACLSCFIPVKIKSFFRSLSDPSTSELIAVR